MSVRKPRAAGADSGIVGEALERSLQNEGRAPHGAGVVAESWGALKLPPERCDDSSRTTMVSSTLEQIPRADPRRHRCPDRHELSTKAYELSFSANEVSSEANETRRSSLEGLSRLPPSR